MSLVQTHQQTGLVNEANKLDRQTANEANEQAK